MQTVGIVFNQKKEAAKPLLKKISDFLKSKKIQVVDDASCDLASLIEQAELIISLGGDGTLLSLANSLHGKPTPEIGRASCRERV